MAKKITNQRIDKMINFVEEELLPISRLADIEFCERRAALHLIEMAWEDNIHTAEGTLMHEHVHTVDIPEKRGSLIVLRGSWIRSLRLGMVGKADVVELRRADEADPGGVMVRDLPGRWRVYPVEYKPGHLKHQRSFQIQLCVQALCLEEMLCADIPRGALFCGQPRRRQEVVFDQSLRAETEHLCLRLHELVRSEKTPLAKYEEKCKHCSLFEQCLPKVTNGKHSVTQYLQKVLSGKDYRTR
jgi:CRISPR-associated exonuclease Cas4